VHAAPAKDVVQPGAVATPQVETAASMADVLCPSVTAMSPEETVQMVSSSTRTEVAVPMMLVMLMELSFVQVAMATAGQTEEGMLEAPAVETAQLEPSLVPAAVSVAGRTEAVVSEASVEDVVMGQVSMPVPCTPAATGQTILGEALPQEGSASPGVGAGPSQALVRVGDEPLAWGGPRIWWAETQNPELTFFILDDGRRRKTRAPSRRGRTCGPLSDDRVGLAT
jgi:hypothetical protein